MHRCKDLSYDLDGDGAVGATDYFIGVGFFTGYVYAAFSGGVFFAGAQGCVEFRLPEFSMGGYEDVWEIADGLSEDYFALFRAGVRVWPLAEDFLV